MAEHEVIKHTVRTVKLFRDKEKKGWSKVKEILLEIAIIVFAITFSLWMHNLSQEKHNRDTVKEFLTGTKEDLESDVKEMTQDDKAIQLLVYYAEYLKNIYDDKPFNEDSVRIYAYNIYFSKVQLIPNIGRYEGFKSNGHIGLVENKKLANLILDHYQEKLAILLWVSRSQDDFIERQLYPYMTNHLAANEKFGFKNIPEKLKDPVFYNLLNRYISNSTNMLSGYQRVIKSSKEIITEIEKEQL